MGCGSCALAFVALALGACGNGAAASAPPAEHGHGALDAPDARDATGARNAEGATDGTPMPAARGAAGEAPSTGGAVDGSRARDPLHGAWNGRLARLVDEYTALAVRHAKGKLRASDVHVSIHVRDRRSALDLAFVASDVARAPASNMKLVTTAAALVLLGPGTEFRTPFEAAGAIRDGVLEGDLVARASGDPVCGTDGDGRVEGRFDALCTELAAHGIRRIRGDLVLDEGSFAEPSPAPGWPSADQYWQAHCALSGGFSVNGGVLQARVDPGRAGGSARVEVRPVPHGLRSNYGVTTVAGGALDIRIGASVSTVTVTGRIPAGRPLYTAEFSHPDPVAYFGEVLRGALARGGIALDGTLRRERLAPGGEVVAELRSSVDATLGPINAESRNSVADQLFLALGHAVAGAGTREAGAEASRLALVRLGVDPSGFAQADGSGLSRDNRVTTRQLTALIAGVLERDERTARTFRDSLAVAGRRGTLEDRMRDTPAAGRVHAKTGWISGVSALSGICETASGRELVFSILIEYPPSAGGLNTKAFKPLQDDLLTQLIEDAP